MSNRHSSSSIGYQSNSEFHTSYVFWCTIFILVRLHNIWVTMSPGSLHPWTGTDSDRVTRRTTYCREHAPSLANVVSTTPVRPPGTLCHLTYMTLVTLTHSRNDLKLFCLIVRTDLLLLLYGAPGRFVERRLTNLSVSVYCIVLYCTYLFINFLLIKVYGSSVQQYVQTKWCKLFVLLEGLQCYKDIHMKACDIKITAELKSDNGQYKHKIYYFVGCFCAGERRHRKHCHIGISTVKRIYHTMIVGRRQVTVRFMN